MRRTILLLFVAVSGLNCVTMLRDFNKGAKNYAAIPLHRISIIGFPKAQVEGALGAPTNVIGAKHFPSGTVEVWAYERWQAEPGPDYKAEEYWVYFLDNQVVQCGAGLEIGSVRRIAFTNSGSDSALSSVTAS